MSVLVFLIVILAVICSGLTLTSPRAKVMNKVVVDCSRAGTNVLFVAVLGPEGQEPVQVKHRGDKKYMVQFMMPEFGTYILYVKWGEQHAPGSPFILLAE